MAALCNRAGHYIFALWVLSSLLSFSLPNLSRRRLDVEFLLSVIELLFFRASYAKRGLGSRNSVRLSLCLSVRSSVTRVLCH